MTIEEILNKLASSEELKEAVPVIQELVNKEAQSATQVKQLNRQIEVSHVASKVGANAQVLLDLIPTEVQINPDGTVQTQDGKTQTLVDYVKADPKLNLYQASIFGATTQTPVVTQPVSIPGSILSGRSQSSEPLSPTAQALKQLKAQQNNNAESVLARFNK